VCVRSPHPSRLNRTFNVTSLTKAKWYGTSDSNDDKGGGDNRDALLSPDLTN
jgi:hypothetical protein